MPRIVAGSSSAWGVDGRSGGGRLEEDGRVADDAGENGSGPVGDGTMSENAAS